MAKWHITQAMLLILLINLFLNECITFFESESISFIGTTFFPESLDWETLGYFKICRCSVLS